MRVLAVPPELSHRVGRDEDARRVENELLKVLSQADPGDATLLALRKARESYAIAAGAAPRRVKAP